jgi:hypothetical protein
MPPRLSKKLLKDCPSQDCRAESLRQSQLRPLYAEQIPARARRNMQTRDQASATRSQTMRCNYCGCVYLKFHDRNEIMGWLDSGVRDEKWVDAKS